jgi:AcrR family transcriptional regulator
MAARRTRRTPEEARSQILEAAESRLAQGGHEAVRVQHIAADLGLTDAAIYHHFGNREGLLGALAKFGARRLRASVEEIVSGWDEGELDIAALVESVLDTFERRGYANLVMWLSLSGGPSDAGSGMFAAVVEAFEEHWQGGAMQAADTTNNAGPRYLAALLVIVCAAEPLLGTTCRRSVGLPGGRPTTKRFRSWFAETLAQQLSS